MNRNFCPMICNSLSLRVDFSLIKKMEDSSWFAFAFYDSSLSDEVIFKLFSLAEGVEGVAEHLFFLLF